MVRESRTSASSSDHSLSSIVTIKSFSPFLPILAIFLQTIIIAFIIVSLSIDVYIRRPGSLSDRIHFLYITGITVLATLISAFTSGQIRHLWALKLAGDSDHGSIRKAKQMATLVGLGSAFDSIKFFPISLSFLITGLITTSIVASLTPTSVNGMSITFLSG